MGTRRKQESDDRQWLTVPEAGRRLGVARPTVLQRALLGELTWKVFAGDVYIAADSVTTEESVAA